MRLDEMLRLIADDLKASATAMGGAFFTAENPVRAYFILAGGGHTGFCVIVQLAGGDPAGAEAEGMEAVGVDVFVGHARDMRDEAGAYIFRDDPISGAKSLLRRVDDIRAVLLTMAFHLDAGDDIAYAMHRGTQQATIPGTDIPLPAYKVSVAWHNRVRNDGNYRFLNEPAGATPQRSTP